VTWSVQNVTERIIVLSYNKFFENKTPSLVSVAPSGPATSGSVSSATASTSEVSGSVSSATASTSVSGSHWKHRRGAPRKRTQKPDAKRSRKKVKCCVEGCTGFVVNLPRHLRQLHKDIPEFDIVSMLKKRKGKAKRTYRVFNCSEKDCDWKGTRPEKHLAKAHGYEKHHVALLAKQIRANAPSRKCDRHPLGHNMYSALYFRSRDMFSNFRFLHQAKSLS